MTGVITEAFTVAGPGRCLWGLFGGCPLGPLLQLLQPGSCPSDRVTRLPNQTVTVGAGVGPGEWPPLFQASRTGTVKSLWPSGEMVTRPPQQRTCASSGHLPLGPAPPLSLHREPSFFVILKVQVVFIHLMKVKFYYAIFFLLREISFGAKVR